MTAILKEKKLFYAAVPKVACTSLKRMFYEIQNGHEFQKFWINEKRYYLHHFMPSMRRKDYPEAQIADYRRLCLVRDPVKRLLSAYSNRVVYHGNISPEAARQAGRLKRLKPNPDLHEFVDRLEAYMAIQDIRGHCRPMIDFLGEDAGYFHRVYSLSEIDVFLEDVSNVVGRKVEAGRYQTGGPKLDPSELTNNQIAKIHRFYKDDYKAFSHIF